MITMPRIFILSIISLFAACTTLPSGPSVLTLPGSGKNFDEFRLDDQACRQFAFEQIGGTTTGQAAATSGIKSTAAGAAVGAAAGAAIGGGSGAAIGAGSGLAVGGLAGSGAARTSAYAIQYQYDVRYIQCMYVQGHLVPVQGEVTSIPSATGIENPPPPVYPANESNMYE